MNNYSFLSSDSNSNGQQNMQSNMQPRAPPSPSPSQNGSQYNGNGAQQNGIPMVNGLPSGGQQTDMNHLWAVVQQLSQMLEDNTRQTAGIITGVNALRARAAEEGSISAGGPVNGSAGRFALVNGELDPTRVSDLQSALQTTQSNLSTSQSQTAALTSLVTDYENALTLLLDKLRPYAYNQTSSVLAIHKHYQKLLEEERVVSMQLRLEHQEWQAGLGRVAKYARGALEAKTEGEAGLQREIKELAEENRVLRRLAGWEPREVDEDEKVQV